MFDKPGLFYSNNPFDIFDNNWMLDYQKINKLKEHKLSVIDLSSEHYGVDGLDYVYHFLNDAGLNFLLLSHEPSDHKKFDRMVFHPYWYHWSRKNFKLLASLTSNKKTYKWGCLNAKPRNHRIHNYFYSKQQSYYDCAYFTFHNDAANNHNNDVILSEDVANFWEETRHKLPNRNAIHTGQSCDTRLDLPANNDSYIHLVTETTVVPRIFITEKTWKPIASGQLFLMFGNPGIVGFLRNQGVDVFDDLIDHSYDSVEDWQDRLHLIHKQLKHLIEQNLEDIYIATHARRKNNVDKFLSGAFDQQYQKTIEQCINTLS